MKIDVRFTEAGKVVYQNGDLLKKIKVGDWIDLRAVERIAMRTGDYRILKLGVSMQLPKGYEALVAPRSSTFKNFGILAVNSIGIIDNSYCGDGDEWGFLAVAMRDTIIEAGDRICQFRIIKNQPDVEFNVVDTLGNPDRGGVGSTGTN